MMRTPLPTPSTTKNELHLARRMFHFFGGILIVIVASFIETRKAFLLALGGLTVLAISIELLRLISPLFARFIGLLFGPLMREGEDRRMSGVAYYLIGCFLSGLLFPKEIALLAILYLAVGDPVASLFGLRFGKRSESMEKLQLAPKSIEGAGACFVSCFLTTLIMSYFISRTRELGLGDRLLFSTLGGFAAMIGELIPLRTDDNLALPLISGALLWLTASVFNLIPGLYFR